MNAPISLTQRQLPEFLLRVALRRPVFVWGPPGTGKSSLVQRFAADVGLPCVSLLGSLSGNPASDAPPTARRPAAPGRPPAR